MNIISAAIDSSQNIDRETLLIVLGFIGAFWFIIGAILFISLVFYIVMLVDALSRKDWESNEQRTLWLIILIGSLFVSLFAFSAIAYYIVIKRKLIGNSKPASSHSTKASHKSSSPKKKIVAKK